MRTATAALVVGVAAASLVPGATPGLGIALAAAVTAAATLLAIRRTPAVPEAAAGAVLLAVMPAVSDAAWILAPALAASVVFASVALAGASTWPELVSGGTAWIRRSLPGARAALAPLADRVDRSSVAGVAVGALRTGGLVLVLVVTFGALFASADRAFAHLASRYLVPDIDLGLLPARLIVLVAAAVLTSSLVAVATGGAAPSVRRLPDRLLRRRDWVVALAALDVLFLAFILVQLTVLFGGHEHVLRTAGLTYAEYAREGFFQLLAVGALTLAVVAATARATGIDRTLRLLLGGLAGLAIVVLASALRRLHLYEEAFGYTRARLTAHAVLLVIAAILVALLVTGALRRLQWMPRLTVGIALIAAVTLVAVRPDALVAERNIERWRTTGSIDLAYLDTLSADAVPALADLPSELRGCVLADDRVRLAADDGWRGWSWSRHHARGVLDGLRDAPCTGGAG